MFYEHGAKRSNLNRTQTANEIDCFVTLFLAMTVGGDSRVVRWALVITVAVKASTGKGRCPAGTEG